ncbi:MAG: helix-turn-helix domain-containing protein [Solirubrobacterales bacterium]
MLEAREGSGMTQSELGRKLGIDRSAIAKIESGTRGLSALELARIAAELDRPLQWFVSERLEAVVSRRSESPVATTNLDVVTEDYANDVGLLFEIKALKSPEFRVESKFPESVLDAEKLAMRARERLGIGNDPASDLIGAADAFGLFAYVTAESLDGAEGAYIGIEGCGVAAISGELDSGRRRFTLAHELGHHLTGDEYSTDLALATTRDERERLINAFAAHFLMPRGAVKEGWVTYGGDLDPRSCAIKLAAEYRLSWSAACSQLKNLEFIDSSTHAALLASPPSGAEHLELDARVVEDLIPPVLSRTFSKAVLRAIRGAKITTQRAAEMLRETIDEDELPKAEAPPLDALRGELAESI